MSKHGALCPRKPLGLLGTGMWGKRGIIYLSLHCHHQNDSCIKMGSDESHFSVLLIVRDKVTRQCPQTTTFRRRKDSRSGIEPRPFTSAYQPNAVPLGQTGPRALLTKLHLRYKIQTAAVLSATH